MDSTIDFDSVSLSLLSNNSCTNNDSRSIQQQRMASILYIGYAYAIWNYSCSYCDCLFCGTHTQRKEEVSQFQFRKATTLILFLVITLIFREHVYIRE